MVQKFETALDERWFVGMKLGTVSEWLNLAAFLGTTDSEVHIVHISRVIVAYTLESLSSLTQITHNLQATINFKKKDIKNETQKSEGTH